MHTPPTTGYQKIDIVLGVCGTMLSVAGATVTQTSDLPISAKWTAWIVAVAAGATTAWKNTKKDKDERPKVPKD